MIEVTTEDDVREMIDEAFERLENKLTTYIDKAIDNLYDKIKGEGKWSPDY
jgi:hypothetical protein